MILKIAYSQSFHATETYLAVGQDGQPRATGLVAMDHIAGETTTSACMEMEVVARSYRHGRPKHPAIHLELVFHEQERELGPRGLETIARFSLTRLGLSDHQWFLVEHTDRPHPHVHIVANRVAIGGQATWDPSFWRLRADRIRHDAEELFHLQRGTGAHGPHPTPHHQAVGFLRRHFAPAALRASDAPSLLGAADAAGVSLLVSAGGLACRIDEAPGLAGQTVAMSRIDVNLGIGMLSKRLDTGKDALRAVVHQHLAHRPALDRYQDATARHETLLHRTHIDRQEARGAFLHAAAGIYETPRDALQAFLADNQPRSDRLRALERRPETFGRLSKNYVAPDSGAHAALKEAGGHLLRAEKRARRATAEHPERLAEKKAAATTLEKAQQQLRAWRLLRGRPPLAGLEAVRRPLRAPQMSGIDEHDATLQAIAEADARRRYAVALQLTQAESSRWSEAYRWARKSAKAEIWRQEDLHFDDSYALLHCGARVQALPAMLECAYEDPQAAAARLAGRLTAGRASRDSSWLNGCLDSMERLFPAWPTSYVQLRTVMSELTRAPERFGTLRRSYRDEAELTRSASATRLPLTGHLAGGSSLAHACFHHVAARALVWAAGTYAHTHEGTAPWDDPPPEAAPWTNLRGALELLERHPLTADLAVDDVARFLEVPPTSDRGWPFKLRAVPDVLVAEAAARLRQSVDRPHGGDVLQRYLIIESVTQFYRCVAMSQLGRASEREELARIARELPQRVAGQLQKDVLYYVHEGERLLRRSDPSLAPDRQRGGDLGR